MGKGSDSSPADTNTETDGRSNVLLRLPKTEQRCSYRLLTFSNGCKVTLISDPETDKGAASCDVYRGSFSDPKDFPGLAHFLEHMLFFSSEKYPEEDAYSRFIQEHGGSNNAYTASESTNYHFEVNAAHLEAALDRFAQFFLGPLFETDALEREKKAVDSENSKNLSDDFRKLYQLSKHLSNPQHVMHKFGTGNYETLKDVDRDAIVHFYEKNYSSHLMSLAVLGKESLDDMENLVRQRFESVPKRDVPTEKHNNKFLLDDQYARMLKVVPEKEGTTIYIEFFLPSEREVYKTSPSRIFGHILGHEGEGSVFAALKSKGWATSLVAGEFDATDMYSSFGISIEATLEGEAYINSIFDIVFCQLWKIRNASYDQLFEIFEEHRVLNQLKFDFRDRPRPKSATLSAAINRHLYAEEDAIIGASAPDKFDFELLKHYSSFLVPQKCRIYVCSKSFESECNETEPWYGTRYTETPLEPEALTRWTEGSLEGKDVELALPAKNPYIPESLELVALDPNIPEDERQRMVPIKLVDDELGVVWYKPDTRFRLPKGLVCIQVFSPIAYSSPRNACLCRLFALLVDDYLNEIAYYADIAGLHYNIRNTQEGLKIKVRGYNDKLLSLLWKILDTVLEFKLLMKKERFALMKEKLHREYKNIKIEQPYHTALYESSYLLEDSRWHFHMYLQEIDYLNVEDMEHFLGQFYEKSFAEIFVIGNFEASTASDIMTTYADKVIDSNIKRHGNGRSRYRDEIKTACRMPRWQRVSRRVAKLPDQSSYILAQECYNAKDENSAMIVHFQIGPDSLLSNVLAELFVHIASRAAFNQLRTKEQLGYIVHTMTRDTNCVVSVDFIIQSHVKNPNYLAQRIEEFLKIFLRETIDTLPLAEFESLRAELCAAKAEKDPNLISEGSRLWNEIENGTLRFNRQREEIGALKEVQLEDFQKFVNSHFNKDGNNRRMLSVQIWSASQWAQRHEENDSTNADSVSESKHIMDKQTFKESMLLYPRVFKMS